VESTTCLASSRSPSSLQGPPRCSHQHQPNQTRHGRAPRRIRRHPPRLGGRCHPVRAPRGAGQPRLLPALAGVVGSRARRPPRRAVSAPAGPYTASVGYPTGRVRLDLEIEMVLQ